MFSTVRPPFTLSRLIAKAANVATNRVMIPVIAATNTAGTGLNGGAGVFLHGANLGLEAAW